MAKLRMFSVQDAKAGIFMRPFFELHVPAAVRSWTEVVNQSDTPFNKFPTDFVLYELGVFDDEQGRYVEFEVPRLVSTALEVLKTNPQAELFKMAPRHHEYGETAAEKAQ